MELSICIPVYNEDVTALATTLCKQLRQTDISTEILLYDDFSTEEIKTRNRSLSGKTGIIYKEAEKNLGRSAMRNKLGQDARGKYLLFLDCDSLPVQEDFIQKYLNYAQKGHPVIVGGTVYPKDPPSAEQTLHWKYGAKVESAKAAEKGFHSNNFLIEKSLFLSIRFNEKLSTYGHEDTFFGFEVKERGINILTIDNAVLHNHLETNEDFLQKTEKALQNLILLDRMYPGFYKEVKLLELAHKLRRWGISGTVSDLFQKSRKYLFRNLRSGQPSLLCFNLYRLGFLCSLISYPSEKS